MRDPVRGPDTDLTLRIGFDARAAFIDPRRGLGRVTRSLADALVRVFPGDVVLFVPHGVSVPQPWYPLAARIVALRRPRRAAFLFDGPAWRWTLARERVDVLHLPAWSVPRGVPVPVVATFHDATPFRFRSPRGAWPRRRLRAAIRSLARADAVHAVSHHAAAELLAAVNVAAARIHVVHHGVAPAFTPAPDPETPRHILFVGGADPHKNLAALIAAVSSEGAAALPPLVVAGSAAADRRLAPLVRSGRAVAEPVVDDDALAGLYRRALALVLPSRNEGFGLPCVEAMACGCPVVAARAGALPEVCGDAAVLLDPDRPEDWRDALLALARDPARRATLIRAGLERARAYSWERTARELTGVYSAAILAARARS